MTGLGPGRGVLGESGSCRRRGASQRAARLAALACVVAGRRAAASPWLLMGPRRAALSHRQTDLRTRGLAPGCCAPGCARFHIMGGECNYLLRVRGADKRLVFVPDEEWKSEYMMSWRQADIDKLLSQAEASLVDSAHYLRLPVKASGPRLRGLRWDGCVDSDAKAEASAASGCQQKAVACMRGQQRQAVNGRPWHAWELRTGALLWSRVCNGLPCMTRFNFFFWGGGLWPQQNTAYGLQSLDQRV
jgi:IMP-specific 5'-nucleotidase